MPLGNDSPSATRRADPSDHGDDSVGELLAAHEVEAAAVEVGVAAAIDD